jgi:molybdenum cofactor biosynthesis enzyme MoaA
MIQQAIEQAFARVRLDTVAFAGYEHKDEDIAALRHEMQVQAKMIDFLAANLSRDSGLSSGVEIICARKYAEAELKGE